MAIVLYQVSRHVVWRDEVRALSIALNGNSIFAMLGDLRGEGHPALWYVLLRGVSTLIPSPVALQITSLLAACGFALLLLFKSPFPWPVAALFLLGRHATFDYSVMARNYGISVLLLFLFASLYEGHRNKGLVLGSVLFLLANTNAHSCILVGSLLLAWALDALTEQRSRRDSVKVLLINGVIAVAGVAVCALTIYPTYSDAALIGRPDGFGVADVMRMFVLPGAPIRYLVSANRFIATALLFAAVLSLARKWALVAAALSSLFALSIFFSAVYPGSNRHAALWISLLVTLAWIAELARGRSPAPSTASSAWRARVAVLGTAALWTLLGLQVPRAFHTLAGAAGAVPFSRSRELAASIKGLPELEGAVVLGDPDYVLEALPYFIDNPIYLVREKRYGTTVHFTHRAQLALSLSDLLEASFDIRRSTGRPVAIVVGHRIVADEGFVAHEGYNWTISGTAAEVHTFLKSVTLLKRFGPAQTDETYDLYRLR